MIMHLSSSWFDGVMCQLVTRQYHELEMSMEKRVSELAAVVTEKTVKLQTYEDLEHALDEVVMHAACTDVECSV